MNDFASRQGIPYQRELPTWFIGHHPLKVAARVRIPLGLLIVCWGLISEAELNSIKERYFAMKNTNSDSINSNFFGTPQ